MIGLQRTTSSPFSSSIRRSTPCVLGCCGPMLMIMVWSLPGSIASMGRAAASASDRRRTLPTSHRSSATGIWLRGRISWLPSEVKEVDVLMRASPGRGGALELHGDGAHRVVLAERVADPVLGHEDAAEVGVAVEGDPEHV